MSLHALRQTSWLRHMFGVLVLCFALSSLAYAGHSHAQDGHHAHFNCDYCTAFGSLIDTPPTPVVITQPAHVSTVVASGIDRHIALRPVSATQARAPPR